MCRRHVAQVGRRSQNPSPLVIQNGEIRDFEVPIFSPICHEAQRLAAMEYCNDRKGQLDKLYAQKGKDPFVASYKVNKAKDGEHSSFSVWSKGVPSLLLETDIVYFFDPSLPKDRQVAGKRHLGCGRPLARHENISGKVLCFEVPECGSTSVAWQSLSARRAQENGFSVLTPDLWKSTTFRVTTVRPCSRPVAAIRPSMAGRGWLGDRRPKRSATRVVMGRIRSA